MGSEMDSNARLQEEEVKSGGVDEKALPRQEKKTMNRK